MRAAWFPVPHALRLAPQVSALGALLRRKDPRLLLIDMWEWARTYARKGVVDGPEVVVAVEQGAGWRGRRGLFVESCVACGWLAWDGAALVVVAPDKVLRADWQVAEVSPEDEEAAKRAEVAAKKRRQRAEKAKAKAGQAGDTSPDTTGTGRDIGGTSEGHEGDTGTNEPLNRTRTPARETDTNTETDTRTIEEHSSGRPDALDDVGHVLARWRERSGMTRAAIEGKAAEKRRSRIRARLSEGWTVERLCLVADGMTADPFLMGSDPKSRPGGYRDVETVFRDNAQCERLEALATGVRRPGAPSFAETFTPHAQPPPDLSFLDEVSP